MGQNHTSFQPGRSGNPSGRPKILGEIRALARDHTEAALNALLRIMNNGEEERAIVAAANAILDRGWGKPAQTVEVDSRHVFHGEEIVAVTSAYAVEPDMN